MTENVGRIEFGPLPASRPCRKLQYGIPGAIQACNLPESHEGPCVFGRTPEPDEIPRPPGMWQVPVPDPTDARIAALEAELAAWREVGAELEWCIYDTDKKEGFVRICPMCHGKYDKHAPECQLAKLLGRKADG